MATVLIVDDHADTCRALALLIRRLGYDAVCRTGGQDALDFLAGGEQSAKPDLVLLDLMMPEVDGLTVLRRLRADPRTAALPVIVFSAVDNPALRDQALTAGANDYWLKAQLDVAQIKQRISAYLRTGDEGMNG